MISILKKELNSFFNTSTGYLVILIFLITNGLFLWVLPTSFNLLESNHAGLDGFFLIAPWIFLFLIPALTMRFFSEEFKTGTIELLLTKPISEFELVMGKYFAGLVLCLISLTPSLIYLLSIFHLGLPKGNIDWGATLGSYIGLIFLSGIYVSIGTFASSITNNQMVAFMISFFLCFFSFIGFDQVGLLWAHSGAQLSLEKIGISYHYSTISRGVIDTRDIIFFLSYIAVFLLASKRSLQSKKWS